MSKLSPTTPDQSFAAQWARFIIRFRWFVILASLIAVGFAATGASKLSILTNYRVFFSEQNPELRAFDKFQATYTKTDNLFFLVRPKDGDVFTRKTLAAIEDLTEQGWQIPFSTRVDSITNFQHTYANGDDLVVEDLIENAASLDAAYIAERKTIALNEPLIRDLLVTADGRAAGVNVIIQLPGKDISELPSAYGAAQKTREAIMARHPDVEIYVSGLVALNNAFAEEAPKAFASLLPFMFLAIFLLSVLFFRSITATAAMLFVVVMSTVAAMGIAGYLGLGISPVSAAAPIVILTLAVADSVHIMMAFRDAQGAGMERLEALVEAIRTNFLAVSVTSITTIIGFLALNFSDAPPFRALGNMSALGIAAAWILSLTLFPALASFIKLKPGKGPKMQKAMSAFA
ncbi:Predicted exporter of the RND superfamily, partial [hydrothermal vent metagenome]